MIFQPVIVAGIRPSLTFLGADFSQGTASSSRTVSGFSFGPEGALRHLAATIAINTNGSITGVTIGGVTATLVATATANLTRVGIAIALVPTGASGSVVVTSNDTYTSLECGLYALDGIVSASPEATAIDSSPLSSTSSLSLSLNVPDSGIVLGVVYQGVVSGSAGNESWSSLTENYVLSPGSYRSSGASAQVTSPQNPLAISVTNLTGNAGRSGVAASFR